MNSPESGEAMSMLPRKVLIAVDASMASQQALACARTVLPHGAEVWLVSVAENPVALFPAGRHAGRTLELARDELLRDAAEALEQARDSLAPCGVRIETRVIDLSKRGGDVVDALVDEAGTLGVDLLVVGARQHRGLRRWVEGTVSEPLGRRLRCPMLVVPEQYSAADGRLPARILFAVDGSPPSMSALACGIRFATPGTDLRAVYAIDRAAPVSDYLTLDALDDALAERGKQALAAAQEVLAGASARTTTALVRTDRSGDDVAHAIMREAAGWNAELIVMGTHGRRGMARWRLGSVAGQVAQITQTPLLLVHASDA